MTADTQLDTLEAKGLIRLASLRPELEYLFRHALVQDAAYGSLLKQERRELHGQVGEALEDLYPERVGELAPVLAMHFEQAGENGKAIDYYASGAQHAMDQNAIQEAFTAYDRAAGLLAQEPPPGDAAPDEKRRRRQQVEVQLGRARAGYSFLAAGRAVRLPGADRRRCRRRRRPSARGRGPPAHRPRAHAGRRTAGFAPGQTVAGPDHRGRRGARAIQRCARRRWP